MIGSAPRGTRASQGRAAGAQRLALTGVRLRGTAHRDAESHRARLRKQPGSEGGQRGERCRGRAEVRPLCRAHFKRALVGRSAGTARRWAPQRLVRSASATNGALRRSRHGGRWTGQPKSGAACCAGDRCPPRHPKNRGVRTAESEAAGKAASGRLRTRAANAKADAVTRKKAALAAKARSACEASEASEPKRAGSLLFLYLIIGTLLRQLSCPLLTRVTRFIPTVRWRKS